MTETIGLYGNKITVQRPEGWTPEGHPDYVSRSYDSLFRKRRRSLETNIKSAGLDLAALKRRYDEWRRAA